MQFKSIRKSSLNFIGNHFAEFAIRLLCHSLSIVETNKEVLLDLKNENRNFIIAFWHGKMLIPWFMFKDTNASAIVSTSKDGGILTNILKKWNYNVQRGSSSKGGKEVLENLLAEAENKKNILITPDGPKGPIYKMKAGAVIVAKKRGIPIVLAGVYNYKKIKLKSWDHFEIPWFFSKSTIKYSQPYFVDNELSYEETDSMIKFIESELIQLENNLENAA